MRSAGRVPLAITLTGLFLLLLMAAGAEESKDSGREKWIHNEGEEQYSHADQKIDVGPIDSSVLRMLLIGKTGVGKSSTGNSILGEKLFESKFGFNSVTSFCNKKKRDWRGRELVVIDTPGLFDTKRSLLDTAKEIGRCVAISSPGPHAIILVLQPNRFTQEEKETVERLQDLFGKEALRYMIVLFTRKDDLESESIHHIVNSSDDKVLKTLLESCGNRYCAFNNKAQGNEREEQVAELIEMIDRMVAQNGGTCFTNEIYVQAEKMIREKEKELKKEYMDKLQEETEKLKREMEENISKIREEMKGNQDKTKTGQEMIPLAEEDEVRLKYERQEEENRRKQMEYDHRRAREESERRTGDSFWRWIINSIKSWFGF